MRYDSPIVRPSQILGYEPSERLASHDRLEQYMLAIRDAARYRVYVLMYEKTGEGKSPRVVFTSTREDIDHTDAIESDLRKSPTLEQCLKYD